MNTIVVVAGVVLTMLGIVAAALTVLAVAGWIVVTQAAGELIRETEIMLLDEAEGPR